MTAVGADSPDEVKRADGVTSLVARMTDDVANALPAYEVGGELGRGAYGRVLQGRHRQLGRVVAIKQLDAALADDATYRAAFLREAQVVADLSHPHVVQVYDFVDHDGLLLLVMEYLDRGSLADAHRRGEMTAETACGAVMAACSGVQFVHERGVLHRDLKPENLMLDTQGTMKVTDFGLARADTDVRRTRRGDLLGSPAYMAPEQAAGGEVGRPADVYTLGVSLYYLLSGAFPHDVEGGTMAVLQRRLTEPPRPLAAVAPDVPAPLAEVVMAALADDPEARPASAELLGQGLGAAAWEAWGPGWIDRSDVKVRAPGTRAHCFRLATVTVVAPGAARAARRYRDRDRRHPSWRRSVRRCHGRARASCPPRAHRRSGGGRGGAVGSGCRGRGHARLGEDPVALDPAAVHGPGGVDVPHGE